MKYIFLGSNSDICKAFKESLGGKEKFVDISRSHKSDIKIEWSEKYKPFSKEDLLKTKNWNVLISFIGTQEPFGLIDELDPKKLIEGINYNFTYQFASICQLLKYRDKSSFSKVIFFAGGGTNNAPTHYSAYITSKIALIKLTELLSAEFDNIHATIIGPGWVKTKIHTPTLENGLKKSPSSYLETHRRFKENDFVPMSEVIACLNIIIKSIDNRYAGRNISVKHDDWKNVDFLNNEPLISSNYKLRRIS